MKSQLTWNQLLPFTFGVIVLSFVAATAFTHWRMLAIDRAALDIADNASPSIERLASARGAVRLLQVRLRDYLDHKAAGEPADAKPIEESGRDMNQAIDDYLSLPVFPGEHERWGRILRARGRLNDAVALFRSEADQGLLQAAETTLHQEITTSAGDLGAAITSDVEFNAGHSQDLALEIRRLRARSMSMAIGLDTLCALVAVVGAFALHRAMRAHAALDERHQRLLEERASELEQFSGRIAHDILNPLNTIGLTLQLSGRLRDEQSRAENLARGSRAVDRIQRLVRGLLAFALAGAKPDPSSRSDVRTTIADLMTELQTAATEVGADIEVKADVTSIVGCNAGVLISLVSNLVRNALKYLGDSDVRRIEVRAFDRGEFVRFEVEDTGPGLPPGLEEHVFEPYVRGAYATQAGIGLGLATVKRLVEGHGGKVGVRSVVGEGCMFWFEMPRVRGEERASAAVESRGFA